MLLCAQVVAAHRPCLSLRKSYKPGSRGAPPKFFCWRSSIAYHTAFAAAAASCKSRGCGAHVSCTRTAILCIICLTSTIHATVCIMLSTTIAVLVAHAGHATYLPVCLVVYHSYRCSAMSDGINFMVSFSRRYRAMLRQPGQKNQFPLIQSPVRIYWCSRVGSGLCL